MDSGSRANRVAHTVRQGIASSSVYGVSSIVATLVLLPIIVSSVGAAPYGVWLVLSALASYMYQADLGIGAAVVHFSARFRGDADPRRQLEVLSSSLAWMTAAGIVALPVYWLLASSFVGTLGPEAGLSRTEELWLLILGSTLVAAIGLRVFPAALQGLGYWVYQRQTQTFGVFLRVAGTLVACLAFQSVIGVALAEVAALLVPTLLSTAKCLRVAPGRLRLRLVSRSRMRELFAYSRKAFAVTATVAILMQADSLIVGWLAGAAAVTYYNAAFRVFSSVNQLMGWVTDPLVPALSATLDRGREYTKAMLSGMMFLALWLAVGTCVSGVVAAPDLIRLWLGDSVPVNEIALTMIVLLLVPMVRATNFAAVAGANAIGKPGTFVVLYAWWCLGNVASSIVLGKWLGIVGVALGTLLPLIILQPFFVRRTALSLGVDMHTIWSTCVKPLLRPVVSGAVLAVLGYAVGVGLLSGHMSSLMSGCGFAVGYGAASWRYRSLLPLDRLQVAVSARV